MAPVQVTVNFMLMTTSSGNGIDNVTVMFSTMYLFNMCQLCTSHCRLRTTSGECIFDGCEYERDRERDTHTQRERERTKKVSE